MTENATPWTETGRLVAVEFASGDARHDCGYDDCECPDHDDPPRPHGVYVTIRLDNDNPSITPMSLVLTEARQILATTDPKESR